jgi:NAD(P)H-dependent flavin oxidoreductase YrpB (nitropropane dioxygenase family)
MIRTPICDLLDIEYPIALGGMGSATSPALVAAVSRAGGLGALGCHYQTPDQIRERTAAIRRETNRRSAVAVRVSVPFVSFSPPVPSMAPPNVSEAFDKVSVLPPSVTVPPVPASDWMVAPGEFELEMSKNAPVAKLTLLVNRRSAPGCCRQRSTSHRRRSSHPSASVSRFRSG